MATTPEPLESAPASIADISRDWLLHPSRGLFRALRHRQFFVFWAGNFVSNIGSWMQNVAQGWLVWELTHNPFWLGAVGFTQQIPALFFSLPGGVIADRASRQKMLFVTQLIMTALAIAIAVLTSLHLITVNHILILSFVAGTTMAINAPIYQAALKDLVQEEDTLNAIALNSIQFNLSRVAGPSLAGFTIAAFGTEMCFYLNALSYLPLLVVILRTRFPQPAERQAASLAAELKEGFRYVWTHRAILLLVVTVALVGGFGLPYLVMMPAFAQQVLHVGAKGLGYLVAAAGIGAFLGGVRLAALPANRNRGPIVLGAAISFFASIILFCLSRTPWLSAMLLAVVGASLVNSAATANSLIQTLVPDQIRGRVLSMHTMAFLGMTPLGSLLVGALAEKWGPAIALGSSAGLALVLTAILAVTFPEIRKLQ